MKVIYNEKNNQDNFNLLVIESGWKDFYHVIYESPHDGDLAYEHDHLSKTQLQALYPKINLEGELS